MKLPRVIQHTIALQAIPAPSFHEAARAAYIQGEFEHAGLLKVEIDDVGNLYGLIPGGDKSPLVVSAHLDSVFPLDTPLQIQRSNNQIAGPGIGDNALSLAVLIELAIDLTGVKLPSDVWLVANVGEEGLGNLVGMKAVTSRFGSEVTGYLVLEGMALGHIYHCGLPVQRYRVAVQTEGGHSWIHADRPSATHTLMQIGSAVLDLPLPENPKATLNIGIVDGGLSINSIASEAMMEIDLRCEDEITLDQIADELSLVAHSFIQDGIRIQVEPIGARPGGRLIENHPLIHAASHALQSEAQEEVQLKCGSTDANIPLSLGYPAICFGLTRGGGAHSNHEYIEIDPIPRGYAALRKLILTAPLIS